MNGNLSKSAFFEWVGVCRWIFDRERGIAHQPLLVSENRVIAVSCGINISAIHHLVLSQYTRLTDGQNCDSNTVRCITCSRTVINYFEKIIFEIILVFSHATTSETEIINLFQPLEEF